jgi:hypothetical protein
MANSARIADDDVHSQSFSNVQSGNKTQPSARQTLTGDSGAPGVLDEAVANKGYDTSQYEPWKKMAIKTLIALATTTQQADLYVTDFSGITGSDFNDQTSFFLRKWQYVKDLFDMKGFSAAMPNEELDECDKAKAKYFGLLAVVIHLKWR